MKKLLLFVTMSVTAIGVQAKEPVDNLGAQAISAADYTTAEARLTAHLQHAPGQPEALLNLAHVYRATGRGAAALVMYERVLERANVQLVANDNVPLWSHDLARRGMAKMQALASR